jgi:UDP-N-acetylbacillosamine N-acetyltransferase
VKKKALVIWGASGHALVVADIIRLVNAYRIIGMIDDRNPQRAGSEFAGYEVLGGRESLDDLWERQVRTMIVAFGNCHARLQVAQFLRERGFRLATAVHPRATVAADVSIGAGSVIVAGSVINPAAAIGENAIINTGSTVDHECVIGDGVHIAPGAHLAAGVSVGRCSWVGIGSVVREGVHIGSDVMIGAGSVVRHDIGDGALAYGVPARIVRQLVPADDHVTY